MGKLFLLFGLNFLLLCSVSAQNNQKDSTSVRKNREAANDEDAKRKNFFLGIGVKGNVFINDNATNDFEVWKKPTLGGNVFVGKWFNKYLGSRIMLEGGKVVPYFQKRTFQVDENYFLGRADILFDVTNCIRSYSPDNFYNLMPYIGIGGAHAFKVKSTLESAEKHSTFLIGGGLWNTFRFSDKFSAYLNVGIDVVDAAFDSYKVKKDFNGIASASVGLVFNF